MKNYLLLILMVFSLSVPMVAQRTATPSYKAGSLRFSPTMGTARSVVDTLAPPAFDLPCGEDVINFISDGWGYVAGTNNYADKQKAQRFTVEGVPSLRVQEIIGFFAESNVVGDSEIRVNIYSVAGGTGAPDMLLGTSNPIKASEVAIDALEVLPTSFTFSEPVAVDGNEFFVSFDFSDAYAAQDTIGLLTSPDGCGDDSDAWEQFSDDSWVSLSSTNSWQLNIDYLVFAVVETGPSSTTDPLVGSNGQRLLRPTPNPTATTIQLGYVLDAAADAVSFTLFDINGRILEQQSLGQQPVGEQWVTLSTTSLAAGTYSYAITTERGRLVSRFVKQ